MRAGYFSPGSSLTTCSGISRQELQGASQGSKGDLTPPLGCATWGRVFHSLMPQASRAKQKPWFWGCLEDHVRKSV